MAYTTLASILGSNKSSNLLNEGDMLNEIITGTISTDMAPGAWVYNDQTTELWIPLDAGTAAHLLAGPGQVGVILFRPRVENSVMKVLNTDDYDVTYYKNVPICISGICVADIVDQGGAIGAGTELIASSTAESCTIQAQTATGATSGTALKYRGIGTLAANVADDDTKAIVAVGKKMGSLWGGINE
jgi:hypothetical protein